MLNAKFQDHRTSCSEELFKFQDHRTICYGEEYFKVLTKSGIGGHLVLVTWAIL